MWILVPIIEPLRLPLIYEHPPVAPGKYGEYPRFIRPVRNECRTELRMVAGISFEGGRG